MSLELFYKEKVKPLLTSALMVLHISHAKDDLSYWKQRAELFNKVILVIDAYVYDKTRVDFELKLLKDYVKSIRGDKNGKR